MDPQIHLGLVTHYIFWNLFFTQFEQKREHVISGIECYMKQYNVSKREVHTKFQKQIVNTLTDINKECIRPTKVPVPLLAHVVNFDESWIYVTKMNMHTHNLEE